MPWIHIFRHRKGKVSINTPWTTWLRLIRINGQVRRRLSNNYTLQFHLKLLARQWWHMPIIPALEEEAGGGQLGQQRKLEKTTII